MLDLLCISLFSTSGDHNTNYFPDVSLWLDASLSAKFLEMLTAYNKHYNCYCYRAASKIPSSNLPERMFLLH